MSSLMHTMLSAELTRIPSSVQHVLGNNFNNTLCNGVTWLLVTWLIVHFCYEKLIHTYLKQKGFTKYLQSQLSNCLWLLAVYLSFVCYYTVTFSDHSFFHVITPQYGSVPFRKVLVHALVCSFYLHRGYVQGLRENSLHYLGKFFALTVVCSLAYILRFLELPCTLTLLVSVSGILTELTKMTYLLLKNGSKFCNLIINSLYIMTVLVVCTIYFIIIPLVFLIPLGLRLFSGNANFLVLILYAFLLVWLNMDIYKSIPLNLLFHWLYHSKQLSEQEESDDEKPSIKLNCLGKIIACSLFHPRTDYGYMMAYLRSEVKKRQKRILSKKKPKNRDMLIQTLKCMMFIKRKLNEKKAEQQDTDEADESDEKLEDEEDSDEMDTENFREVKKSETIFNIAADNNNYKDKDVDDDDDDDDDNEEIEIKSDDIENNIVQEKDESHTCSSNSVQEPNLAQSETLKECSSGHKEEAGGNGFSQ